MPDFRLKPPTESVNSNIINDHHIPVFPATLAEMRAAFYYDKNNNTLVPRSAQVINPDKPNLPKAKI
jgi:hypothetical protein